MNRALRWVRAYLCLTLLVVLAHCMRPMAPTLTPKVARVAAVTASGIDLDIELQVENPNAFALHAQSVTGTMYVGSAQKRLAHGSSQPGQSIPARGSVIVPSRIHVAWEDATALSPLLFQEKIPYSLHGDVALGSEDWNVTLPFSMSGELSRAQLFEAGWRGL